jgi:hypothetical protein
MEQMPNSVTNAELITSAPTCHNTMLAAGNPFFVRFINFLIGFLCPSYTKWRILEVFHFACETYCLSAKQNTITGFVTFKVVKVCQKEIDKTCITKHFSESS